MAKQDPGARPGRTEGVVSREGETPSIPQASTNRNKTHGANRRARLDYARPLAEPMPIPSHPWSGLRNVKATGLAAFWDASSPTFWVCLLGGDATLTPDNIIAWIPLDATDALGLAHGVADGLDDMRALELAPVEGSA
jgi:hypothetical protein